ncbi:MAG: hypothetical protein QM723_01525 [Myxococcaceae bacterium]
MARTSSSTCEALPSIRPMPNTPAANWSNCGAVFTGLGKKPPNTPRVSPSALERQPAWAPSTVSSPGARSQVRPSAPKNGTSAR